MKLLSPAILWLFLFDAMKNELSTTMAPPLHGLQLRPPLLLFPRASGRKHPRTLLNHFRSCTRRPTHYLNRAGVQHPALRPGRRLCVPVSGGKEDRQAPEGGLARPCAGREGGAEGLEHR